MQVPGCRLLMLTALFLLSPCQVFTFWTRKFQCHPAKRYDDCARLASLIRCLSNAAKRRHPWLDTVPASERKEKDRNETLHGNLQRHVGLKQGNASCLYTRPSGWAGDELATLQIRICTAEIPSASAGRADSRRENLMLIHDSSVAREHFGIAPHTSCLCQTGWWGFVSLRILVVRQDWLSRPDKTVR
ncbi:uncharacterized protein BJX67DRAFT_138713 [Aspergillus lucknowensis]|uniref:Secreted protein n=1 Tax=Aspergillus lucknowensis TaxID=176173 RepID=A0ABR4LPF0_9EURO